MKQGIPLVLGCFALSACVAITVQKHRPRRGPVKEVGYVEFGGGEVRYSAEGWSWIVASRRRTARKLMSVNCGSDLAPVITDEYPRMDADAAYNGEDIDASMRSGDEHYHIERYVHLAYECRPKGSSATALSTATVAVALSSSVPVAVSIAPAVVLPATSSATLAAPEPSK